MAKASDEKSLQVQTVPVLGSIDNVYKNLIRRSTKSLSIYDQKNYNREIMQTGFKSNWALWHKAHL
jgi:hypothetical protein